MKYAVIHSLKRLTKRIKYDRINMVAAAMSYYALFAFVPALTSVVLIYASVSSPESIHFQLSKIASFMPQETFTILQNQLTSLSSGASARLGWSGIGAFLFSTWSASKGSRAIMEAMNVVYDKQETRSFIELNRVALGITFFGAILGVAGLAVIVGIPAITNLFRLGRNLELALTLVSWPVLLGLFSTFLSCAYHFGPNKTVTQWRWLSRGALVASVLWALASLLFSWYADEFANFNKTYGALGAIIVLMTWFYVSSFVILIGGEINAEFGSKNISVRYKKMLATWL